MPLPRVRFFYRLFGRRPAKCRVGFLKRAQKRDELFAFCRGQFQAEFVPSNGIGRRAVRTPTAGNIGVVEAIGIEHLFQIGGRAVVKITSTIPDAFERRNLVIPGAFASFKR